MWQLDYIFGETFKSKVDSINKKFNYISFNTLCFDIVILIFVLLFYFTLSAGSYPWLLPDEARYTEIAWEMVSSHDYITPHLNGVPFLDKPPFFYWLEAVVIKLFGLTPGVTRLIPAIFAILGSVFTYLAGCCLYNRLTGLLAAFILSTSIFYFIMAHYVNMDMVVAVLLSGALFAFICACQFSKSWQSNLILYSAYIFVGLAIITKGLIGIILPMMIIGIWIVVTHQWTLIKKMCLLSGLALTSSMVAPWLLFAQKYHPNFFHYFFVTQQLGRFLGQKFHSHMGWWFFPAISVLGIMPWTVFLLSMITTSFKNRFKLIRTHSKESFLYLWVLLMLIFFSIPSRKLAGYILPIFPPLALLMANYLLSLAKRPLVRHLRYSLLALMIFMIFCSILLVMLPYIAKLNLQFNWVTCCVGSLLCIMMAIGLGYDYWRNQLLLSLRLIIVAMLIFAWPLAGMVQKIHLPNSQAMVTQLQQQMEPNDQVVAFETYVYDLPLYFKKHLLVVTNWYDRAYMLERDNWRFELGVNLEYKPWLLTPDQFWQLLMNSQTNTFIVFPFPELPKLRNHIPNFTIVGDYGHLLLGKAPGHQLGL